MTEQTFWIAMCASLLGYFITFKIAVALPDIESHIRYRCSVWRSNLWLYLDNVKRFDYGRQSVCDLFLRLDSFRAENRRLEERLIRTYDALSEARAGLTTLHHRLERVRVSNMQYVNKCYTLATQLERLQSKKKMRRRKK